MTIKGCMFDFSGTLLRIESAASWLRATLAEAGIAVREAESAAYARRLARSGGQPGGPPPEVMPPHLEQLWRERDRSAAQHRAAYTALAREAELPWEELYDQLYDRHMAPAAWTPYPDAAEVLGELRRRGIAVAVVSNIGWDLRPVFREHGLDRFVDVFVLSFEHGVQKPEPGIFRIACEGLGLPPEQVAMVGDDRHADAGAAALGCPVHLVDHLPVERRPDALWPVLGLLDEQVI
ncbi:HAD family hydrolase [Actinacidiphila oryziradicis]|uniref:HAD family hydrolase n=1 Tax=Actinacidiphila oryziradicis TaxID=2571141 RepID=A0A4U0S2P1_9ACTN|nr:HAD family hydrolase [Actinacidiphila oryziradicis]TKA03112.1 HAD family hydrolase [Actinacidiphila oryziradicis]